MLDTRLTLEEHISNYRLARVLGDILDEVEKQVVITIFEDDFNHLKDEGYNLCFAKKVGNEDFNVVWRAGKEYLENNKFRWQPQYQIFASNTFEDKTLVDVWSNTEDIFLGEVCLLNEKGHIEEAKTGTEKTALGFDNEYGRIHVGVNQLSKGVNGKLESTPIYVSTKCVEKGHTDLIPVEKVLVWFEQGIATSTMFSTSRSKSVEIDLTKRNSATRMFKGGEWTTP